MTGSCGIILFNHRQPPRLRNACCATYLQAHAVYFTRIHFAYYAPTITNGGMLCFSLSSSYLYAAVVGALPSGQMSDQAIDVLALCNIDGRTFLEMVEEDLTESDELGLDVSKAAGQALIRSAS